MTQVWVPGAGPHHNLVTRLHAQIREWGEQPYVEVELNDGSRVAVQSISPDPGDGFVTVRPHPEGDPPDALIIPLSAIRRIEISRAREQDPPLGFTLPS